MNLTSEDVADILRIVDGMEADRLRLSTARFDLLLVRDEDGAWSQSTRVTTEPVIVDAPAEPAAADVSARQDTAAPPREGLAEVRAPLPGAFYRAPKPGAAPFVEVGSQVTETAVVGIVETMKLMNSVPAGVAGTVTQFCLSDGEFAEQGTVLMYVDTGEGATS